jgi:hypothetical protein
MKTLMQMFADEDQGVIFYETVLSIRSQRHTVIECVPLPWEQYDIIPGYFKVCLLPPSPSFFFLRSVLIYIYSPGINIDVRSGMVTAQETY